MTNFDHYRRERATVDQHSRDDIVQHLRNQSKRMNKIDNSSLGVKMESWEITLSAAIHPDKLHVGVYASEIEAARAYDRGIISALGLDAAPLLNFNLVDYLDQFSPEQVQHGVDRGLMPSMLPPNWRPPPVPLPKWYIGQMPTEGASPVKESIAKESKLEKKIAQTIVTVMGEAKDPQNNPVPRRKSITPRSVLDEFSEELKEVGSPMLFDESFVENLDIAALGDWSDNDALINSP